VGIGTEPLYSRELPDTGWAGRRSALCQKRSLGGVYCGPCFPPLHEGSTLLDACHAPSEFQADTT